VSSFVKSDDETLELEALLFPLEAIDEFEGKNSSFNGVSRFWRNFVEDEVCCCRERGTKFGLD
jgi:hypothetical protein